jgi:putative ABC transport system permease protein
VYLCGFLRWLPDSDFLIRVNGEPARLARAAREAIAAVEPGRAVYAVQPLPDILSATLSQYRLRTVLLGAFSIIALTLAAVGLWGVMAYMVSQRRREFAVRLALGAQPIAIALQIARSAGLVTIAGGGVGLLTTAAALRLSRALMAGVQISDPTAYLIGVAALLGTVVVASISPGWRAMSVDPVEILRD